MKKILFLIILLSFLHSYADAQIALTGNITTIGVSSYPTHIDSLGKGGYMTMPSIAARDGIPTLRRKYGMLVYVQATDVLYKLGSVNLDNSNWVEVSLLSATTNIQTFLASPTSANLSAAVTNVVGTGSLVFSNNPTLTNATLSGTLTLTAPLSIINGGTGTNTATGTGSVVLSTSPSLTGTPTAITADASSNSTQIATTAFVKASITNSSAPDATSTTKGILKLTNDLGGSADAPTVNSVGGVSSSTITTVASAVNSATSSNTPNAIVKRDGSGGFSTGTITGTLSGTASNAIALTAGRTIGITGDITYTSASFDGTGNVTGVGTLTNTGVTANTYGSSTYTSTSFPTITVDSKGRITSAISTEIPTATRTVTGLLSSSDYEQFDQKLDDITPGLGIDITTTVIGGIGSPARRGIAIGATDADVANKGIIKLAGDLTGTADLPTVNTLGGVASTTIATAITSATPTNTASTIVKRDASGGFAAGAITATSISSGTLSTTSLTATSGLTAGAVTYPIAHGTSGQVLSTTGSGTLTWTTPSTGITGVGTITTTSYANGATVSGNNLILAPADANFGGVVSTFTQTFAGAKTFNSDLVVNGLTIGKGKNSVSSNTAVGLGALISNTSATVNTGIGINALNSVTSGGGNTAVGANALVLNTGSEYNTAMGYQSLYNTTGAENTGFGKATLYWNTNGSRNTAIGMEAGVGRYDSLLTNSTAIGAYAIVTTSNTIQLGADGSKAGTNAVTSVKTSGALTTGTVTYPIAHGANGQVLSTTGSGTLTWTSNGLYSLNGISAASQTFSTTTTATSTSPSFTSSGTVHTLNIPSASVTGTTAGLLSNTDYNTFSSAITSATSSNTANTIVRRDGSGGFAAGLITATSLSSTGNISSTSLNTGTLTATSITTGTLRVTGGTPTLNAVLTSDGNGNATWASNSNGLYTLNGISAASQIFSTTSSGTDFTITGAIGTGSLSTTAIHAFNLPDASLTNRGVITTGTQTIAGQKSFANAVTNSVATDAGSSTNIDFSLSNLAYTSASPGPGSPGTNFTLTNMKNGGTYTLAVQGTTSGTASFTASGLNGVNVGNYESVSGKQTVYTFVVMGSTFYYSMVTEL